VIYFLQSVEGGPVKIGYTADVETRHKSLESLYGKPLALLATLPGGRNKERAIHERFAPLRLGRTEQFRPAAELMAFIGRPLLVDPNPDAVEVMGTTGKAVVLTIKGTDEWREWLEGLSKHLRTPTSTIVDHALVRYAKESGYQAEAPER
jgi:hypothetical protein